MPRAPRDTAAGVLHITLHSVWTSHLFRDDVDRMDFLRELAQVMRAAAWTCICFCLMTNHAHFILEVGDGTLPDGMHELCTHYACRFNSRHGLRGHVFGRRYGARRIASDAHLAAAFAYVARNPVEAGLCQSPADWEWGSYRATVGLAEQSSIVDDSRVLRFFGGTREQALARLRDYVEES
jgi:putative transposase